MDFGFEKVSIAPCFPKGTEISGRVYHTQGDIFVKICPLASETEIKIELPQGLSGIIEYGKQQQELTAGFKGSILV